MSIYKKKVNKPISLAGCIEICKKVGIPESTYSQWGIYEMFDRAKDLAEKQQLKCKEVFVSLDIYHD